MTWRAARCERLDDQHLRAAAWAGMRRCLDLGSAIVDRLQPGRRRCWWCCCRDQLASSCQCVGLGAAAGEQSIMPDAMQALGQDVEHESTDELARRESHGLVPAGTLDAVVLDLERDAGRVG